MAKYTAELRDVVKSVNIFDFPYDFYDPTKKGEFERKFIAHFAFREIGTETPGRFVHYLRCKMDEVFPYYNVLLKTAQVEYDLLENYKLTETLTRTTTSSRNNTENGTQTGTSNSNATTDNTLNRGIDGTENSTINTDATTAINDRNVESDTPSGLLAQADITKNVYASKANIQTANNTNNTDQSTAVNRHEDTDETGHSSQVATGTVENVTSNTAEETGAGEENYTLTRKGNIGVAKNPEFLQAHIDFQKNIMSIYTDFFAECDDLFMQIY